MSENKENSPNTTNTEVAKSSSKSDEEHRGIPEAQFFEDLEAYLKQFDGNCDSAMKIQNELYGKYKFLESSFISQKATLLAKLPEINKTLKLVKQLSEAKEEEKSLKTSYQLSDNCFAKAEVHPDNTVFLWLGANIMVEYSYQEAQELLEAQQKKCNATIAELTESCLFLRDQITTTEVNIARIYNYDVKLRQQKKKETEESK
eukprot:c17022_g1_i1.p1 GENE.c17022_g1_i1~~c17022_g1_i1.p1  ORF type:complete len:210 (+),score=74.11 c17022_g1_i1:24-632(+)